MTRKTLIGAARRAALAVLFCGVAGQALAQDQAARIAALEQQIAALAAQVAELKKSSEADAQAARAKPAAATVSIASGKPVIASADGDFSIALHAVAQLDIASYDQDAPANGSVIGRDLDGGSSFRRARLFIEGKAFGDFDYRLMAEFAGLAELREAYLQYSGLKFGDQTLRIRGGAFTPNVGLQDAASQSSALFLERASAAEIARNLAGGDRRIGLQFATNADRWLAAAAVTGGKLTNGVVIDEQVAFTARLAGTPLAGPDWRLHLGANATLVTRPPQNASLGGATAITLGDRPELRNDPTQLIATGALAADEARQFGLEFAFQKQQFLVQSEYVRFDLGRATPLGAAGDPRFDGYYVEGSWMATGEARSYDRASGGFNAPKIDSSRKWGALELALRYSFMDLNFNEGSSGTATPLGGVRGGTQEILAAALNWYPNSVVRFSLQYQDVAVDRLNAAGSLQIGQDYQAIALRNQIAF